MGNLIVSYGFGGSRGILLCGNGESLQELAIFRSMQIAEEIGNLDMIQLVAG